MIDIVTGARISTSLLEDSPFLTRNPAAYAAWKTWKMKSYPSDPEQFLVTIADPYKLASSEYTDCMKWLIKTNSVLYRFKNQALVQDKDAIRTLGEQFGLIRLDGNLCADDDSITSLTVMPEGTRHEGYIPYTNRAINWHTDGYYNSPDHRIQAMLLHCVQDAEAGGENNILDPEILYILLRDENPEFIDALMQDDAMTIPANIENGVEIRAAQSGAVFSVDTSTGNLHTRYTARKRNIIWKDDPVTQDAVAFIEDLFSGHSDYIYQFRMSPGEGIISNNALHTRTAFTDSAMKKRLIFRARYYDRIRGTDFKDIFDTGVTSHAVVK